MDYPSYFAQFGGKSSTPFGGAQPIAAPPDIGTSSATQPSQDWSSHFAQFGGVAQDQQNGSTEQPAPDNAGERIKAGLRKDIAEGSTGGGFQGGLKSAVSGIFGAIGDIGQAGATGLAGAAGNVASLLTRGGARLEDLIGAHDQSKTLDDTADSINQWVEGVKQSGEKATNVILPKWATNIVSEGLPFVVGGELGKVGDIAAGAGEIASKALPAISGLAGWGAKAITTAAGMAGIGGVTAPEGQGVSAAESAAVGVGAIEGLSGTFKLAAGLTGGIADDLIKSQIFSGTKSDATSMASLANKIGSDQPNWKTFVQNWKSLLPEIGGMPSTGYQGLKTGLNNTIATIGKISSKIQSGLDNGINNDTIFDNTAKTTVGDIFPNFADDMAGIKGNGDPVTTNNAIGIAQRTFLNILYKMGKAPQNVILNATDEESGKLISSYNNMFNKAQGIVLTPSEINTVRQELGGYAYTGTPTQLQTVKSQALQKMWQSVKSTFSKVTNNAFDQEINNQQTLILARNGIQSNLDTIDNGEAGIRLGNLFRPHTALSAATDAFMNYPQYRFGAATALNGLSRFFDSLSGISDPSKIGASVNKFATDNPEFAPAIKEIVNEGGNPKTWATRVKNVETNLYKERTTEPTPPPAPPTPAPLGVATGAQEVVPPTPSPKPIDFSLGANPEPTTQSPEALHAQGVQQDQAFQSTVKDIGETVGASPRKGPVKSAPSIADKQATQDLGKSGDNKDYVPDTLKLSKKK